MQEDSIPSYEEIKRAGDLIKEAVAAGVLADNEDHQYVYLNTQLPNGSYVWQPYSLLEAALDLIRSGNIGLLEDAIKKKRSK